MWTTLVGIAIGVGTMFKLYVTHIFDLFIFQLLLQGRRMTFIRFGNVTNFVDGLKELPGNFLIIGNNAYTFSCRMIIPFLDSENKTPTDTNEF